MGNLPPEFGDREERKPGRQLGLKHETEEELLAGILGAAEWSQEDRRKISEAYEFAKKLHLPDIYKDRPYTYHLLRVASRIVRYMEVADVDIVVAALLHDIVEDHALELLTVNEVDLPGDPVELQAMAAEVIRTKFGDRSSQIVKAVTNAPSSTRENLSEQEKNAIYSAKIEQATSTPEGWLVKFADWCDNGLGLIHSEFPQDSAKLRKLEARYRVAYRILERRFVEYRHLLSPNGANYVRAQLDLGRERLEKDRDESLGIGV